MGAALIVKPVLNRYFSVITFGIAQIAMDIEPGIGMLTGAEVLHGPTHTILGALIIALLVTLISPSICVRLLERWNAEVIHYKQPWLAHSGGVSRIAVIVGAVFGTLSHVALDSLIHHDIHPLLPFSRENPLAGLVQHDEVYRMCAIAGALGAVAWLSFRRAGHLKQNQDVTTASDSLKDKTPKSAWVLWVKELRFTWFWLFIFTVIPIALFGTAISSIIVLAVSVLIGIPLAAICSWGAKSFANSAVRRLAVMVLVPAMTLVYVMKVDQRIPENATAITNAVESFQAENGRYPESLEMLTPKHLEKIPRVRFSIIQPHVVYRITDGKPFLAIPSAVGDAFAQYEYDFHSKVWVHRT